MIRIIGDKLRQYDLNRLVELAPKSGLTLESVSFQKNGPEPLVTAHREEGGMIVADIPNILLKAYGTLTVECYLVDADGYHISEKASFTVCKRDMPVDYEYVATPVLKLGAGGAFSWNDMPDKPFYENKPFEEIVIDSEVTTGLETRTASNGVLYCKLYDKYIPRTDVESIEFSMGEGCITVPGDKIVGYNDDHGWIASSINVYASDGHETSEFPEGIWIVDFSLYPDPAKVVIKPKIVVKPIDTKFLPEPLQFGETEVGGDTLTWDGNTEGLTSVEFGSFTAHKVSDAVFSVEDCANGVNSPIKLPDMVIQEECVISNFDGVTNVSCGNFPVAYSVPPECVGVDLSGVTFPEAGTYLVHAPFYHCSSLTIPGFGGFPSIKPIDKKYLPADAVGSTRFYVHTDYHKIYVDPANEVEATSADVDAALDKGPVYFEDMLAQHITSMFQIELGNNAGYYIRLFHSTEGTFGEKHVTTSDFEAGVE